MSDGIDEALRDAGADEFLELLAARGIPDTISTVSAIALCMQIGKCLRTVNKQFRPRIVAQLRNDALQLRDDGHPTAASLMLDAVVASWEDFGATGEDMGRAFANALQDVKVPKRRALGDA